MKYIYRPVKPFIVNQKFGENNACVSTDGKNRVINCDGMNPPAGYKSLYGIKGHQGLDLAARHGQEVYCALDGKVYMIDANPKSGLDVRIESTRDGRTFRHIYEHLLGYQKKVGDTVKTGELIGWADNTGYSSGDHLHFQVEELKGSQWLKIDPQSVLSTEYALDILSIENKLIYLKELVAKLLDRYATRLRG